MCEDAASQSAVQLDAHLADRAAIYLQFLESEAASKVLRAARLTSLGSVFLAVQFARKFFFLRTPLLRLASSQPKSSLPSHSS